MTNQKRSNRNGALNAETTEPRQGMQSSGVELILSHTNRPTSATWDIKAPKKASSQTTPNSQELPPNVVWSKIIQTFANKLVALGVLEWRSLQLVDGRKGWALYFDDKKWIVDPVTKELTPL